MHATRIPSVPIILCGGCDRPVCRIPSYYSAVTYINSINDLGFIGEVDSIHEKPQTQKNQTTCSIEPNIGRQYFCAPRSRGAALYSHCVNRHFLNQV